MDRLIHYRCVFALCYLHLLYLLPLFYSILFGSYIRNSEEFNSVVLIAYLHTLPLKARQSLCQNHFELPNAEPDFSGKHNHIRSIEY